MCPRCLNNPIVSRNFEGRPRLQNMLPFLLWTRHDRWENKPCLAGASWRLWRFLVIETACAWFVPLVCIGPIHSGLAFASARCSLNRAICRGSLKSTPIDPGPCSCAMWRQIPTWREPRATAAAAVERAATYHVGHHASRPACAVLLLGCTSPDDPRTTPGAPNAHPTIPNRARSVRVSPLSLNLASCLGWPETRSFSPGE